MRGLIFTVVGIGLAAAASGNATAAQPNERRREFVEGVLRVLVETQVLPHLERDGQPPPGGPPAPRPAADPRYREARTVIEEFSAQSGELIAALRQEEPVRPELRPSLGDAIAVKAMTDALLRRADVQPDAKLLADSFPVIDQHWRTLSTRLEGSLAVSRACRECVRKLNACDGRVCQKLGISPQVDQEQLVQLLATLAGHLRSLLDDLAADPRRSRDSQILLIEGRRLQTQVNFLMATASRPCRYDEFLAQYRVLHRDWLGFANRVRSLDFPAAERRIRCIGHVHRQMHELLWIPVEVDRAGLARLAAHLSRDVDAACERISLKMLLAMPKTEDVVEAARELQAMCADFSQAASGNDALDSLQWDFRTLDVQWQQFRSCFQGPSLPELSRDLDQVDEDIQAVQELLGITPLVDLEQAIELAGEVDSLTDLLCRDLAGQLAQPASPYTAQFRRDAAAAAEAVHTSAHQLHDELLHHPQSEAVRKNSEGLSVAWQSLQAYVSKLDHRDRALVTRHYEQLAPAMARLQMIFVY